MNIPPTVHRRGTSRNNFGVMARDVPISVVIVTFVMLIFSIIN